MDADTGPLSVGGDRGHGDLRYQMQFHPRQTFKLTQSKLDGDFVVTSMGVRRSVSDAWFGDLPEPEWVYFGDAKQKRPMNHQQDSASDQFWRMQGNLTVFGFGREYRCRGRYMSAAPAQFTLGLAGASDFETMQRLIESAWRPGVRAGARRKMTRVTAAECTRNKRRTPDPARS